MTDCPCHPWPMFQRISVQEMTDALILTKSRLVLEHINMPISITKFVKFMRGSMNFHQEGPGQADKKEL